MDDWIDHLTTLFPEVRLKRFIEMRGADAGQFRELLALPGLWTGLLYDSAALDGAATLIADWTAEERQEMRNAVPKLGLATPFRGRTLRDVAREVVTLAQGGLTRRARVNDSGEDETRSLKRLWEILEDGKSPADELLEAYHGPWKGDIDRLFETQAL